MQTEIEKMSDEELLDFVINNTDINCECFECEDCIINEKYKQELLKRLSKNNIEEFKKKIKHYILAEHSHFNDKQEDNWMFKIDYPYVESIALEDFIDNYGKEKNND